MAEIAYTIESEDAFGGQIVRVVKWTPLANGDTGKPYFCPFASSRVVEVTGTFGVLGSVKMESSFDPAGGTWLGVGKVDGTAVIFSAAGMATVFDGVYRIKPRVTAGDITTALTVRLMVVETV